MNLASSNVFLNASTELMSGFGTPCLTASPMGTRASCSVVLPTIFPARTSLSNNGSVRIATSIGSSPATRSAIFPTVPYSITSLWPEDASKLPANSRTAPSIAPLIRTFNSAALRDTGEQTGQCHRNGDRCDRVAPRDLFHRAFCAHRPGGLKRDQSALGLHLTMRSFV